MQNGCVVRCAVVGARIRGAGKRTTQRRTGSRTNRLPSRAFELYHLGSMSPIPPSRFRARPLAPVFVLGGHQTDFSRSLSREGKTIVDLLREAALGALEDTRIEPRDIESAH